MITYAVINFVDFSLFYFYFQEDFYSKEDFYSNLLNIVQGKINPFLMKIYLVEDDEVYADFITKSLKDKYDIELFANAEDCLKSINESAPEVLVLDYKLPGMSGIDFFQKINPQIEDYTKVIMLSSIDDGNLVLDFIKKGIRDYVVKDDKVIESLEAVIEGEDDYFFDDFD